MNERIREIREKLHITQIDLAKILGVSNGNVGDWERGRSKPGADALASIVKSFGVSAQWLLTGKGEMFALNYDARDLNEEQIEVAESQFSNLTTDQAALINAYEKLSNDDKDEIWHSIRYKLSKKSGLGSDSQTSKAGGSGSTKTA